MTIKTNKPGNPRTVTVSEPGGNIFYQPDTIISWSDGSALQRAQVSGVMYGAAKINVTAVAYLVVKWRNKKDKNKHPSAGDGSPARPA